MKKLKTVAKIVAIWISISLITALIFPMLSCGSKVEVFSISVLGGEAESADQKAKVLIPITALNEEEDISIKSVTAPELSGGLSTVGDAYEFGPEGMTFERPVTIILAYQEEDLPEGVDPEDLLIVTITDNGQVEPLSNIRIDSEASTISGDTSHFSLAAVTHVATESPLEITPGELDFGSVLVNTTETQFLRITNPTDDDVEITDLKIVPFAGNWAEPFVGLIQTFSVLPTSATPFTLPAGSERIIQVNFGPTSADDYRADLLVSTQDATTRVRLAGTGVLSLGGLSIAPNSHDFGPVILRPTSADKETAAFSLDNNSLLKIKINSVQVLTHSLSTGFFNLEGVSPAGSTLGIGKTTPLQASYTPQTTNLEFGYILVQGTDSDGSPAGAVSLLQGYGSADIGIKVDPLDFGEVLVGNTVTLDTTIYNTGLFDFDDTAYSSNSWSFLPKIPRHEGPLASGNTKSVAVTFTPQTRGPSICCHVEAVGQVGSDTTNAYASLEGTGVDAELTFNPSSCDFGGVCIGETGDYFIEISNIGDFDVSVTFHELGAPFEWVLSIPEHKPIILNREEMQLELPLEPILPPIDNLSVGESRSFYIRFAPTADQTYQSALMVDATFDYRGQTMTRRFNLWVTGAGLDCLKYKGALTVDPIDFGDVLVGTEDTKLTWITNTGDLTPNGYRIPVKYIEYVVPGAASAFVFWPSLFTHAADYLTTQIQVPVTFTPQERGDVNDTIEVVGSTAGKPVTASAQVTGTGVAAELTGTPQPCNFGVVCVGESKEMRVNIKNTGDFDLTVTGYKWPEDPFSLISTYPRDLTLAKNESFDYNFEFTPPDEGIYQDIFTIETEFIYHGEAYTQEFYVTLTGEGILCVKPWSVYIGSFTVNLDVFCPITPIYYLTTTLLVYGDDPEPMPGAEVTIRLTHPNDDTETITVTTDANGEARTTFTVNADGQYTVEIVDITGEYDERPMEYAPESNAVSSVDISAP